MYWNGLRRKETDMDKQTNKICCERCRHYCRVVDREKRSRGYVCALWLDGIAGSADWFYPDAKCFEKNTRDGKIQNHTKRRL